MILADKITEERKRCGWSQEELADKLGVSRQAVSKWESTMSIPDLDKVIKLADLFGVSTDYLLRDDLVREDLPAAALAASGAADGAEARPLRRVSLQEANEFLALKQSGAPKIANAVSFCIMSPIVFIILGCMAESPAFNLTEGVAAAVGCIVLFLMIAAAVFTFISYGTRESRMEHLEKEAFETEYGVTGMVKERKAAFEPVFSRRIAVGVVLCIVAVVPLLVVGAMGASDLVCGIFTGLMLALIAAGVNLIIRAGMVQGSFNALLQEEDYSVGEKRISNKMGPFAGIYWCIAVAIYLGWSFWTDQWDFTWIVWPVAGVLYAAASGIAKTVIRNKQQ